MDSGGQFTAVHEYLAVYSMYKCTWLWTVVDSSFSCINEYLAMDSGGQFIQLYK